MIRIAIQTKGRLNEDSLSLLREAGIKGAETKQYVDSLAAVFILQGYLDSREDRDRETQE